MTIILGSSNDDESYGITTANDGSIYITGKTSGNLGGQINGGWDDAFITKFNSDGEKQWTKLLGDSHSEYSRGITTGDDGSIYITGTAGDDLDGQINKGRIDIFIPKNSRDGEKQWTKLVGSSEDEIELITTGLDGSIYIIKQLSTAIYPFNFV